MNERESGKAGNRDAGRGLVSLLAIVLLGAVACSFRAGVDERPVGTAPGAVEPLVRVTATSRSDGIVVASATPQPRATATASPTVAPTLTPAPLATLEATPEVVAGAELLFQSRTLDVYADPEIDPALRNWLLAQPDRFDQITRTVEQRVGASLNQRVVLRVQPPQAGEAVRDNCPARGAAMRTEDGHLVIFLFADEQTDEVQREAVVAHEIAHQVIFSKLGPGGDTILNEGLANWAIPELWREWQEAPSYDSFVLDSISKGSYVPLTESVRRNFATPEPGENCFETRDQLYNEWASFSDFLIRNYGWNSIRRFWSQRVERGEEWDYRVGFGKSLAELEQEWLTQLGRRGT